MGLHNKWMIGTLGSWLVSFDDNLRLVALILGLIVSALTIANLTWDLVKKFKHRHDDK